MTYYAVHTKTANEASTLNEKTELMRQYFETLDVVKNAIKLRFDQDDLHILKVIERFILSGRTINALKTVELVKDLNKNAVIIKLNELQQRHKKELRVYRPKAVGPLTSKKLIKSVVYSHDRGNNSQCHFSNSRARV